MGDYRRRGAVVRTLPRPEKPGCDAAGLLQPGSEGCLAILWLAAGVADIVRDSISVGNAPGDIVELTVTALVAQMTESGMAAIPVNRGL